MKSTQNVWPLSAKKGEAEHSEMTAPAARQACWSAAEIAQAMRATGDLPVVHFVTEAAQCPLCDGALKVNMSRARQFITMQAGAFQAIETLKQCAEDCTGRQSAPS